MSKYTSEQKAEALNLLADVSKSYAEIRDALGIPVGTLAGWAKGAGIERTAAQKLTEAATKVRMARIASKRERLKEKLLKTADGFVDRAVVLSEGARRREGGIFLPTARDTKDMMTAAAIALDKFRLEMGEATQVTEQRVDSATKARSKVDELAQRRAQKTA